MEFAAFYVSPRVGCSASDGGEHRWWREWGASCYRTFAYDQGYQSRFAGIAVGPPSASSVSTRPQGDGGPVEQGELKQSVGCSGILSEVLVGSESNES